MKRTRCFCAGFTWRRWRPSPKQAGCVFRCGAPGVGRLLEREAPSCSNAATLKKRRRQDERIASNRDKERVAEQTPKRIGPGLIGRRQDIRTRDRGRQADIPEHCKTSDTARTVLKECESTSTAGAWH